MAEKSRTKIKKPKKSVIILLLVIVYICLVCLPYSRQGKASEETQQNFKLDEFFSDNKSGEKARILVDNEDALETRIRLITGASERIALSTFEFREDNSGKRILAALYHAAERGVKIEILADGFPYMTSMFGKTYFRTLASQENVTIKVYNPVNLLKPMNLMARLHDKYLIIDDWAYIIGGRNTYDYFLGDETDYINYDWDILVTTDDHTEPESLKNLEKYFESVWNLPVCKTVMKSSDSLNTGKKKTEEAAKILEKLYSEMESEEWFHENSSNSVDDFVEVNKITLISNSVENSVKEPTLFYTMTELMKQADGNVTFHTPYILCNSYMLDRLKEVCDSGKSVTMMTNSVANNGNPFGATDYDMFKQKVLDTGVQILEYDQGVSYHGKCFVIGEELSAIGSFNWDMRSAYLDTELMLVVDSPELNQQMRKYMSEYEKDALTVTDLTTYELKDGQVPRTISKKRKFRTIIMKPLDILFRFLF